MSNEANETWISPNGELLVVAISASDEHNTACFKIVTNDEEKTQVEAPRVYKSLLEAMKRVDELEGRH